MFDFKWFFLLTLAHAAVTKGLLPIPESGESTEEVNASDELMSERVELNRAFELVAELVEFISFVASFCMVSYTEFELLYLVVRDALSADLLLDKAIVLGAGKEAICRVLTEVTDEDL